MKSINKGHSSNQNQNTATPTSKSNADQTKKEKTDLSSKSGTLQSNGQKQAIPFKISTNVNKNTNNLSKGLTTPKASSRPSKTSANHSSRTGGNNLQNLNSNKMDTQVNNFVDVLQADSSIDVNVNQERKMSNDQNQELSENIKQINHQKNQSKKIGVKVKNENQNQINKVLAQGFEFESKIQCDLDNEVPDQIKQAIYLKRIKSGKDGEQNLRCRTHTPNKPTNLAQVEYENDFKNSNQEVQLKGLTIENLEQFDLANSKLLLQKRQTKSPSKILQKYKERQERAEFLRSQIEQNKRARIEKIRNRQQETLHRLDKKQQEKLMKLNEKIDHARENRNIEISNIKQKAQNDLQMVEDIKYIMKMNTINNQLDYNNKLNETEERRNQRIKEKLHKLDDFKQKEEEVHRKRLHMQTLKQLKLQQHENKRKTAALKKKEQNNEKKKLADIKREKVKERKSNMGKQNQNLLQMVGNQDNVWDLISQEEKFKGQNTLALENNPIMLEKRQLIEDSKFFDKIISFTSQGKMNVNFTDENDIIILQQMLKRNEFLENSSQDEKSYDSQDDKLSNMDSQKQLILRNKLNNDEERSVCSITQDFILGGTNIHSNKRENSSEHDKNSTFAEESEGSSKNLISDVNGHFEGFSQEQQNQKIGKINSEFPPVTALEYKNSQNKDHTTSKKFANLKMKSQQADLFNSQKSIGHQTVYKQNSQPFITDEEEELILIESRINMALKRNVLRDTISEDLEWAYCIKNEYEDIDKIRYEQAQNYKETKSLENTPERKKDSHQIREKSCDVFGSASSRRRFKRSSRINSRRSSKSSIQKGLNKSKSKDQLHTIGNSSLFLESKFLGKDGSKNKRHYRDSSRDSHDSQFIGRSSFGGISKNLFLNNSNLHGVQQFNLFEETTKDDFSVDQYSYSHFGSQMNQLITSMKPQNSVNLFSFRLSTNALKYIFPLREQKILFKRPGKDGQFISARIIIKLEDLNLINQVSQVQVDQAQARSNKESIIINDAPPIVGQQQQSITSTPVQVSIPMQQNEQKNDSNSPTRQNQQSIQSTPNNQTSQNDTPTKTQKKQQNTPTHNSNKQDEQTQEFKEIIIKHFLGGNYNDILKNEDTQKSIELNDDDPQNLKAIEAMLDKLETTELSFKYCRLCETILTDPNHGNENAENNTNELNKDEQQETQLNLSINEPENDQNITQSPHANDDKLQSPMPVEEDLSYLINHVRESKNHKKMCNDLGIKEIEDMCFSILSFNSQPGDISKELIKEKQKALKRKVKNLRLTLSTSAQTHESAGQSQAWKDYSSLNKKNLQIKSLDLEKQVNPVIRDYEALEQNLKEILKVLQYKNQGDLMLFRKLKFIPTLVDICKRILICPKQEFRHLGKVIEISIKIIAIFCSQRENRNYMLLTNRILPLVDLLSWCMNRPTQIFFGIGFLPQLFSLISLHLKHRTPFECHHIKEQITEVLICSTLMPKIKNKFSVINYPMALDVSQMNGQVPMFLLKCISFLEALTSIVSSDAKFRPIYERNAKLGEHYLFVIENTEIFGVIQMLATLLLTHSGQFKTSFNISEMEQATTKVMPQTFLSLAIVSMKVLNNIIRIDVKFIQEFMHKCKIIQDHLFHLLNYLLVYSHDNFDKCEDTKELLHETLMFIGYYCLLNENTQQILHRGENTILQKLCNLPFPYFSDKKFKEILFPTLIMASFKSERSVAIMNQEMSLDPLIKFLQYSMKEELPRIMEEEFDYQSISSFGEPRKKNRGRGGGARSPSISSNTSSMCSVPIETLASGNCPYLPLVMRFPKSKWQDAVEFYSKFNE